MPVIKNNIAMPVLSHFTGPFKNSIPAIKIIKPIMVKNCSLLVFMERSLVNAQYYLEAFSTL